MTCHLASKYFQDIAPSKKLREMEEAAKVITQSEVNSGVVRAVKTSKQVTEDAKTLNSADEDKGMNLVEKMYLQSTKKGREAKNRLLDLKLIILFCAGSLPTNLASQWYWKDLWALADPKYPLPSRDQIENKLIPAEQASINEIQLEALRNEWNLTISFDGGTTTGREAFWTINVSDMRRNVYLLEGKEATGVSHTAAWIKDFAMSVSKE